MKVGRLNCHLRKTLYTLPYIGGPRQAGSTVAPCGTFLQDPRAQVHNVRLLGVAEDLGRTLVEEGVPIHSEAFSDRAQQSMTVPSNRCLF